MVNGIGDLSSIHTAWFDAALKDDPQRLDAIPPVLLYFMGENTWHGFDALPEPSAQRSWYLGAGGSLDDEPGTTGAADYLYDPLNPVPTVGGATMIHGAFPAGPATQAAVEARDDVLVFTSAPVEEKLTLFGEVRATFFASSSAVDTDFVVRLCKVAENATSPAFADAVIPAKILVDVGEPVDISRTPKGTGGSCPSCAEPSRARPARQGAARRGRLPDSGKPMSTDLDAPYALELDDAARI
ncbi:CocE/NonD family hydrolase [Arthrobacter sp. W4I7]|uniref:CocE/NonD family hydrolase n=1 Tax=Arthrobacter sp. W4I7 TaxID=3042296 RepID=UPI00277FFA3D|nr:CocE/NonD family hydrolase [Arthrobacter sp. W4I7]MDQ0693088.1 putative CocE/NonD family hydrolase [Arthrobacter sp. W4I7]